MFILLSILCLKQYYMNSVFFALLNIHEIMTFFPASHFPVLLQKHPNPAISGLILYEITERKKNIAAPRNKYTRYAALQFHKIAPYPEKNSRTMVLCGLPPKRNNKENLPNSTGKVIYLPKHTARAEPA